MKKLKRFLAIIASVLAVSLFVGSEACQIIAYAVGQDVVDSKLYMSEVKMFYSQTEAEAKAACEKEGFIFCPTNLNEGGVVVEKDIWTMDNNRNVFVNAKIGIYMGYKTTENLGEAITNLTLLDMKNTHFEEMDYEEYLNKHIEEFRDEAAQMMLLVNELDRKMKAGSPNAIMAYDSLNLMYVDESKPHDAEDNQLGYYLINKADITFFEKFIQRGSTKILSKITDLLCNATSDYNEDGTTWVDRAKVSEVAYEYANATSETKNMYDQNCEDTAKKLVKALRDLKKTYSEAKTRPDTYGETLGYSELEGMTEENGVEKLSGAELDCRFPEYVTALRTYALLDAFPYQKKGEAVVNNAVLLTEESADEETDEQSDEQASEQESEQTSEQQQQIEEMTVTYTKDMSLAEYLMELASDNTLEDHIYTLYPIVMSLSQAQRVALSLGGLNKLVEGLYQSNDYLSKRSEAIKEATQKLRENGCADGRLYLWTGMDTSLYDKKVVQTDALKEAAASGIDLQNSINEAERKEQDTLNQTLIIIDICTLGYGGIMMITNAILGSTLWAIGANMITCAGVNLAAGVIGSAIGGYLLGGLLCAMWALNIIAIVVGLVMLIYSILKWTGFFDQPDAIDYTNIPDVAMDARQAAKGTYQVRYDAVHSNAKSVWNSFFDDRESKAIDEFKERISEEYAEMSSYMAIYDRWIVMYYSKSPDAGKPIEVKPGQEPFVTSGSYKAPEGYRSLTLVTGNTAVDVNDVDIFEKKGTPLYVFFPGKASGTGTGGVVSDSGTYVTKVRLSYSEKREDAINLLKKDKYDHFDVNLTPYSGYTFLGYQLGSAANALTDIRLSNSGSDAIVFGDASYGKMGQDGKGTTPDGLSLFATASKSAGSPIVSISIENKRLGLGSGREPVCLFSGGDAVDIGTKWKDNILECGEDDNVEFFLLKGGWTTYANSKKKNSYQFLRQDDPDNGLYLYFQPKEQFKSTDENGNAAQRYIAGFSYFLAGDKETDKDNNKFDSNYEYMQKFAKSNGFELLQQDGEPFRVMSDEAGEMTMGTTWSDAGGYPVDTYHFDQFHTVQYNTVVAGGDGGLSHGFINYTAQHIHDYLIRENEKMIFHTAMYFGVAYTYNPYRAITGITGLITPYTEKNNQIKNTGMKTPAGTFQACNVSMQGSPMMSAGITAGYYNAYTMSFPFYTNYEAKQRSNLDWMTHDETEIMSHYLMTSGARDGVTPLKEGDITFSMSEKPGEMKEYVPLCDLRTPGDYEHPLNLALDTTNKGSKYLYLFLKKNAGGRVADKEEKLDSSGEIIQEGKNVLLTNEYTQKKYVAAVF